MTPKKDIFDYLDEIQPAANEGYTLTTDAQAFFAPYLRRYGFDLTMLTTRQELVGAIRYCNALDFEKLVSRPAPTPSLRFLWNRLRKFGRPA